MVSRFDLYRKAGDEAVDDDPAYNIDNLRQDLKSVGKALYGKPRGVPDTADLVQGFFSGIDDAVEAFTPGKNKADRENYTKVYEQEEAKQKALSDQYGPVSGRFEQMEKARTINEQIGDRQTSGTGQFFRNILGPGADITKELAQGKPFYELSPMQMADAAFAVVDLVDVIGVKTLLAKGLTTGARKLVQSIANATTREDKLRIAQSADPKTIMELRGGGFTPDGVMRAPDDGMGSASPTLNKIDKFDDYIKKQSPSRKYKLDITKKNLKDLNETMTKIKSGELEANLGADNYKNVNRIFLNRLLKENRFNPEDYLDFSLEEIEKTLKSKNAFRKQNFQENKKLIQEYINKSDPDSLTSKEVADHFDVGVDMVKSNFSSKPEYKSKFIVDKYHPVDGAKDFSFVKLLKQNQEDLGIEKINRAGTQDRSEYLLFDGLFRSTSPLDFGLKSNATRQEVAEKFFEYMKKEKPNWRSEYRDELNNLAYLDQQKNIANRTIENMFNDYKTKYPKQFANENVGEYKLQISHNFPLKGDPKFLKGAALDAARLSYSRTNNVHHAKIESQVLKIKNKVAETGKITEEQLKKLDELDKKAKKLGTLYFTDIGGEIKYIGEKKAPGINTLVNALEKHFVEISNRKGPGKNIKGQTIPKDFQTKEIGVTGKFGDEFVPRPFDKGGPVKMAIGGDPLENINQQQFASDPATDDNFFTKAVQDENLLAFNPLNLFKVFKEAPAVATPNKVVGKATDAPTGTLPATTKVDMNDFPFKSHFIETLSEKNIPNIDSPQGWRNLFSGTKGFAKSELEGAGILGYLEDAEKFMPGMKITKENLIDVYERSPIANLEIKVKTEGFIPGEPEDYKIYSGSAKHKNMGNAAIDEGGTDYRNIVINVKKIPGQEKPFFNQGHFDKDPNVLAFTRVANYKNAMGDDVAVIQELQTDLITNLRKEQERIKATVGAVRNKKQSYLSTLERFPDDTYIKQELDKLNAKYPEEKLKFLESTDLTRPADPVFLDQLAPELSTQLNAIQDQINNILAQNRGRLVNPNYMDQIKKLQDEGLVIFNRLFDLNRQKNFDDMLQGTFVTDAYEAGRIEEIGRGTFVPNDRPVETFGQIPFGKGPDWIDLMLKATIQDAQNRGINKVAIMPSDIVNKRWSKDADGSAGEKFQTIYDKISVQELKNIAKKYTGNKANLKIEEIVDPNKNQQGFRVLNKGVNGEYEKLKELDPNTNYPNRGPEDTSAYNYDILNLAKDYDFGEVIIRKEIAPGQSMDYAIKINKAPVDKKTNLYEEIERLNFEIDQQDTFELVPAKEGVSPQLIVEEFNPSVTKMYVLTLPEETTKKGPMFLFRKKDGGKIKSDGLVSITDIYGDY